MTGLVDDVLLGGRAQESPQDLGRVAHVPAPLHHAGHAQAGRSAGVLGRGGAPVGGQRVLTAAGPLLDQTDARQGGTVVAGQAGRRLRVRHRRLVVIAAKLDVGHLDLRFLRACRMIGRQALQPGHRFVQLLGLPEQSHQRGDDVGLRVPRR